MSGFFFNEYPYTDFHELNLSWVVKKIIELNQTVKDFVSLNVIKYADPIQWNITNQYEKNTVVVEPLTGTAYLSVAPVPTGVAITNTDYWTPIFDLDLATANQNITLRDDGVNVLSTFSSVVGDWLIWNSILYRVIQDINTNEAYVVGYNIERYTVELFVKDYITEVKTLIDTVVGDLDDLNTSDKTSVVNAINSLISDMSSVIGDLTDLNTTDKSSLVNAVNEILSDVGDLTALNTTDKDSLVNAVNEVLSLIGDLTTLTTTDKTSVVAAMNEINQSVSYLDEWRNIPTCTCARFSFTSVP